MKEDVSVDGLTPVGESTKDIDSDLSDLGEFSTDEEKKDKTVRNGAKMFALGFAVGLVLLFFLKIFFDKLMG